MGILKRIFNSLDTSLGKINPPTWEQNQVSPAQKPQFQKAPEDTTLQQVVDAQSIEGCLRAYTNAISGSPAEQLAIDKVKKLVRDFNGWMTVHQSISPSSTLGIYALEQMPLTAITFYDWQELYSICSDSTRSMVLAKMAAVAHDRREQVKVYDLAPNDSPIKASMLMALKSQAKNLKDWTALFSSAEDDLQRFAAGMMIEMTPEDIDELGSLLSYNAIDDDAGLRERVLTKIKGLKIPLDKWTDAINSDDLPGAVK